MTFEKIVSKFGSPVFNHCLKMIGNKDDAEDLTQEIFVKIYHNLKKFRGESSLKTWIYRITVNTYLTKINSKEYKSNRENRLDLGRSVNLHTNETPETTFIKNENKLMLNEAIKKLSPEERQIILLYYVDSLSYKEIGEVLDLPIGTISVKLYRSRQKLKNFIMQEEKHEA